MLQLVPLLLVLGQAGTPAEFNGVSYLRPDGWQERTEAELRALVPPRARPGQLLMVMIASARPSTGDPGAELTRFADAAESGGKSLGRGSIQSQQVSQFTVLMLLSKVDAAGLGPQQRIYQLVTDGRRSAFLTAVARGDETLADNRAAMLQLMASARPAGSTASGAAGAATSARTEPPPSRPAPATADAQAETVPAGSGIPYGPSTAPVLDSRFRPSGRGRPIPPPSIADGKPVGLWWNVHNSRSPFFISGSIYSSVFLPDGTLVHFFRPGGPHLVDLDGMRSLGDGDDIGRYSVSGGTMTTELGKNGEFRRSKPISVRRDPAAGVYFLFDNDEYHPAVPLTRQSLVGTWKMGAMGTFTFRPDGTVVTTANMIEASWGRADSKEVLTGRWVLDGYLLALHFPKDGDRVYPVFDAAGSMVLRQSLLTRQ